jgi:hypothetical protein
MHTYAVNRMMIFRLYVDFNETGTLRHEIYKQLENDDKDLDRTFLSRNGAD